VKLVVEEPESARLRELLEQQPLQLSSAIAEVEVVRAVRRAAPALEPQAQGVVAQLDVVEPGEPIRARAASLEPVTLRTLDAIHLATALELEDELEAVVTYDARLAAAADALGLRVLAPS
jgi:predicted nucleic acid-binding protein